LEKYWRIKNQPDKEQCNAVAKAAGVSPVTATLLIQRHLITPEQINAFFHPDLAHLHDPFLMKDMERAVARIEKAIKEKEKVLIYGDYDVDGTTAVAMLYTFLKEYNREIGYYIPDRYNEGYGISYKGIDFAADNHYSLLIALDCGIKAIDKVEHAKKRGVDVIICDHHTPAERIPDAVAVLDPKRPDCNYPFKELSGCGVGFKLLQAYCIKNLLPFSKLEPFLDLVAVSIASDIVPIMGENRILAYYGLQRINRAPRRGLKAIAEVAGIGDKEIEINDIVFKIGPRLNAAGRMESGKAAVDLLISDNPNMAADMGDLINEYNTARRTIDNSITQEALRLINESKELQNKKATVIYNPTWHKGVVGIVASRLTETYYRPTIVLTESNGLITGSARSVGGFDLYHAIESCSHLLENFGGHMYAAGLTLKKENLSAFKQKFEEVVAETILQEQLIPVIEIDTVINLKDINYQLVNELKKFQPFGPENMIPVFLSENVVDNGTARLVGNEKEHLKLNLIQEDDPYKVFPAIAFGMARFYNKISLGQAFDICYHIEENCYMGQSQIQLRVKDIDV